MTNPEEGDQVWYVPDGYGIIIKVTVQMLDAYGDFVIDEPTVNSAGDDDLFWTQEEAAEKLLGAVDELMRMFEQEFPECSGSLAFPEDYTLEQYRADRARYIGEMQEEIDIDPHGASGAYSAEWPDKDREDWLSLREVRELHGTPRNEFEALYSEDD
jgi:hypothetical protein